MEAALARICIKARGGVVGAVTGAALMCLFAYVFGANPEYGIGASIGAMGGAVAGGILSGGEVGCIGESMLGAARWGVRLGFLFVLFMALTGFPSQLAWLRLGALRGLSQESLTYLVLVVAALGVSAGFVHGAARELRAAMRGQNPQSPIRDSQT